MAAKKPTKKAPAKKSPAKKKSAAKNKAVRPDDKRKTAKGAKHTSSKAVKEAQAEIVDPIAALLCSGHSIDPAKRIGYTHEIGAEIAVRISSGESLNSITRDAHMPHRSSVLRWVQFADDERIHKDPELREKLVIFREHYDYARLLQAEHFIDEVADISDDGSNDYMVRKFGREEMEVANPEVINRSKLRAETRKWLGEVYLPKVQALRNRQIDLRSNQPLILQFDKQDEEA